MNRFSIHKDIQKQDGSFRYAVDEIVDLYDDTPVYSTIYRGTLEECRKLVELLEKGE